MKAGVLGDPLLFKKKFFGQLLGGYGHELHLCVFFINYWDTFIFCSGTVSFFLITINSLICLLKDQ